MKSKGKQKMIQNEFFIFRVKFRPASFDQWVERAAPVRGGSLTSEDRATRKPVPSGPGMRAPNDPALKGPACDHEDRRSKGMNWGRKRGQNGVGSGTL